MTQKNNTINEEAFNKFCLSYFDSDGNPFMYLSGVQIVQNPVCKVPAKTVIDSFRNYINKK